jgi:hypothetical protein
LSAWSFLRRFLGLPGRPRRGRLRSARCRPQPPLGPSSRGRLRQLGLPQAGCLLGPKQHGASSPPFPYPSDSLRFFGPLLAGTLAESKEALSQSISSPSPRRSSSTRCNFSHTPASCQSRKRRQQVEHDPQPIFLGSISHGMPLVKTKTIPVRAARSSMRGLPPLGLGSSSGNSGSTISQSSSVTSSLLMPMSVTSTHQQVLQCTLSQMRNVASLSALVLSCCLVTFRSR